MLQRHVWSVLPCLLLAALALAGCQRNDLVDRKHDYRRANATYPWQMPSWLKGMQRPETEAPQSSVSTTGAVTLPNDKGHHPKFEEQDSLDPTVLAGDWLVAAYIRDEEDYLEPPDKMSVFKFAANGTMNLLTMSGGEILKTSPGTWEKSGPGMLLVAYNGGSPYVFYTEFHSRDFLFLWTFEGQNGVWLVRRPADFSREIGGNDFTFQNGEHLHITQAGAGGFTGTIDGAQHMEVDGGYNQGILNLRWIDRKDNVDGYAAFVVSPDWKELHGVAWLSDFTSSPFGEVWETSPSAPTPVIQPPAPGTAPPPAAGAGAATPPAPAAPPPPATTPLAPGNAA